MLISVSCLTASVLFLTVFFKTKHKHVNLVLMEGITFTALKTAVCYPQNIFGTGNLKSKTRSTEAKSLEIIHLISEAKYKTTLRILLI